MLAVWGLDPDISRVDANHNDFPLPEPSGCVPRVQRAQDRFQTNEQLICWLALFSTIPEALKDNLAVGRRVTIRYLLVDNTTGSS